MRLIPVFLFIAGLATAGAATAEEGYTTGLVRKIKPEAGLVVINHARMENLHLPAATGMFQVSGAEMLGRLAPGQTIEFKAERVNGRLTITGLR